MATKAIATRTRTVYVKRAKHRSKAGFTLPLAVIAGFAPLATNGLRDYSQGGLELLGTGLTWRLTGYNMLSKKFDASGFATGLGPILLGLLVHKLAGKVGINRALSSAGVPFLRV
jgi:hypothetical protein